MVRVRWRDPFVSSTFADLDRLRKEMNYLFDSYFRPERAPFAAGGVYPSVNLYEDNDAFRVVAELPGVNPDEMEISVHGDSLVLKGERKIEPESPNVSYHRRERKGGTFNRVLSIPKHVNPNKVEAQYRNGILTVVLPKGDEAKPRKITVAKG